MTDGEPHKPTSFIARIWLEGGVDGEPVWRGHIRYVQDGRQTYFKDLAEMHDFLERVSGVPGPDCLGSKPDQG
jgi:hypothetical protein